jgi:hypothetical protein
MHKNHYFIFILLFLSNQSWASKARLQALGEDKNGSQFISDNRNIFLNPAHTNLNADLVSFEWGGSSQEQDQNVNARGEGGVLKSSGNFVLGLHMGHESDNHNKVRSLALKEALNEENNVDFFIGGDAGTLWGFNVTYGKYINEQENRNDEATVLRTRAGVIQGDLEGFVNVGLTNNADVSGEEYTGKTDLLVGGSYNLKNVILFANMQTFLSENRGGAEYKINGFEVGIGQVHHLNDKSKLFSKISYDNEALQDFEENEIKTSGIPATIGLEVNANTWLTLRGSISQSLYGVEDNEGDKKSIGETKVNAGASIVFGDMMFDGVIGTDNDGNGADAENTSGGRGQLRSDSLMSRVSMNYKF